MSDKKYYWLKLKNDFFKRQEIKIIESMSNGKDYVLFYLKILLESITNNGRLRFNDTIPYSEQMLATITDTNIDIVRSAMKIFIELKLIEVLEDSTIFMNEVSKMLGSETKWAEKKRVQRQSKEDIVPLLSSPRPINVRQEKDIELEKDIDIELEKDTPLESHVYTDTDFKTQTGVSGVVDFYEKNIGVMAQSVLTDLLFYLGKGIESELIITCLKTAVDNNRRSWSYARGMLTNLIDAGIQTQKQYLSREVDRHANTATSIGGDNPKRKLSGILHL